MIKQENLLNHDSEENQKQLNSPELSTVEEYPDDYFDVFDLYNDDLTVEENFQRSKYRKVICIEVSRRGEMVLMDNEYYDTVLNSSDRFILKADDYMQFDRMMIDYDTIFGTRFLRFMQYKSDFFDCQERVLFEALLIKFRKNNFKPFYFSKSKVKDELGIKPDKAESIFKKFVSLGFLKQELVKTYDQEKKRPQQVNYFWIDCKKLIALLPNIYKEDAEYNFPYHRDIQKYLAPAFPKDKIKGKSLKVEVKEKEKIDLSRYQPEPGQRYSLSNTMK